jgi:putative ABC transport system substrate-binding protein
MIRRREFIAGLGSAAACPFVGRAQQGDRMRRVGVLMGFSETDPEAKTYFAGFTRGLSELGWTDGSNLRIDYRLGASNADLRRKFAAELVALNPDVILAGAGSLVGALQEVSRTVPIVFATVIDPVGGGFVESLSRPGGNATGFVLHEFSIGAKWLELLKEIAPAVTRIAVIRDPTVPAGSGEFAAIQTAAPSLKVELIPIGVRDADEIVRGITAFAREPKGGLIMAGPPSSVLPHRDLIITMVARYRLPAVYSSSTFAAAGGLVSYSSDLIDQYRRAAVYVDRILRGEKPNNLPVQQPTKFELVINLKTAKALGLTIPETLLATADEVIQ